MTNVNGSPGNNEEGIKGLKQCLRRYMRGEKEVKSILILMDGSSIRVLDMFPKVCDEMFEWFINLAQLSELESGSEKALPMRWALDTLNAIFVRIRESSPNEYMAKFTLAMWSVKYRKQFDKKFWAGLGRLKVAAHLMWQKDTAHIQIKRLQELETLCKASDEDIFTQYPKMKEMVQLLRKGEGRRR